MIQRVPMLCFGVGVFLLNEMLFGVV